MANVSVREICNRTGWEISLMFDIIASEGINLLGFGEKVSESDARKLEELYSDFVLHGVQVGDVAKWCEVSSESVQGVIKANGIKTVGKKTIWVTSDDADRIINSFNPNAFSHVQHDEILAYKEKEKHQTQIDEDLKNMILSTCQSVDGYKAVNQCGLVFGECIFKSGFLKRLSASIDNIGSALSLSETEFTGSMTLIQEARTYALNKMKREAANRGANAIIGIDSESSFGGDIIHITIYGTAVRLEKAE